MPTNEQQAISVDQTKLAQEAMRKMFGGLPPVNSAVRRFTEPAPEPKEEIIPKTPFLVELGEVCDGEAWHTIRRSTSEEFDYIDFINQDDNFEIRALKSGRVLIDASKTDTTHSWTSVLQCLGEVMKVCRTTWHPDWGKTEST